MELKDAVVVCSGQGVVTDMGRCMEKTNAILTSEIVSVGIGVMKRI